MENVKQNICLQLAWSKKLKDATTNLLCFSKEASRSRICLGLYFHSKSTHCFDPGTQLAPDLNITKRNMRRDTAALNACCDVPQENKDLFYSFLL